MAEWEILLEVILILGYGACCYLAGKGDLANLIPKMLLEKAKEIEKNLDEGKEDG